MANNLAAFNAQAWSKRLVQKLDQVNVLLPLINRDYEGDLENMGDTVKVRTPGSITMGAYTKGGSITYQDLTPVVESFTVSDSQYFAFLVDDIDRAQNDLSAMDIYMKRAVVAINNLIEAKIASKYSSAASSNQVTGGAGAAITADSSTSLTTGIYSLICSLNEKLSKNNVPEEGRWLIVHPAIRTLLLNDTSHFIRSSDLGDYVVRSGRLSADGAPMKAADNRNFIGVMQGFDVFMRSTPVTDGTNNYVVAGNRESITYAGVINQIEALRLQSTFANAVRGLVLHDATVFAENAKTLGYIKVTN